jgi:monofunctional biosynthetic peptidoglycan transglycosylase
MAKDNATVKTLFDFTDLSLARDWTIVNDGVMGGRSESNLQFLPDSTGLFSGEVSLANNGGFASTRTLPRDFGLGGYDGIQIRVKGDGRCYQFRIRTDARFDGVAYKQEFETRADEWLVIDLPFERFTASFRGRPVAAAGPVDPTAIRQIGFLIADKKAGPFELKVDYIRAYRTPTEL